LLGVLIFVMRKKLITKPITSALISAFANDSNTNNHEQE
jgi:hypothetical protein